MCDHPPTRSKSLGIANLRSPPNSVIYTLFTEAACAQLSKRMLPWVDAGPWLRAAADITNTNRIPSPTDNTLPNVANTLTHPRTRETVDTRGRSFVHDSFFLHTHKDRNTHIHSQMQDEKKNAINTNDQLVDWHVSNTCTVSVCPAILEHTFVKKGAKIPGPSYVTQAGGKCLCNNLRKLHNSRECSVEKIKEMPQRFTKTLILSLPSWSRMPMSTFQRSSSCKPHYRAQQYRHQD